MADDDFKKLKRSELLRMLLDATRENERLQVELASSRALNEIRELRLSEAGNLAEAALKLNGVFESAQAAADHYLENVQRQYEGREQIVLQVQADAEGRAQRIESEARERARQVEDEAGQAAAADRKRAQQALDDARQQAQQTVDEARESARETLDDARQQAQRAIDEARERAQQIEDEARARAQQALDEALERAERHETEARKILEDARIRAEEMDDEAQRKAAFLEKDVRKRIDARMAEAERVSSNLEQATKVRCDNTMRHAMDEARQYNETMRMALRALGVNPAGFPLQAGVLDAAGFAADALGVSERLVGGVALESEGGMAEPPASSPAGASNPGFGEEDDDGSAGGGSRGAGARPAEFPTDSAAGDAGESEVGRPAAESAVMAGLDEAVSSARAAVAAALSTAKTEPATLDDDAVAMLYPNAVADDAALRAAGMMPPVAPSAGELAEEDRARTASIIEDAVEALARSAAAAEPEPASEPDSEPEHAPTVDDAARASADPLPATTVGADAGNAPGDDSRDAAAAGEPAAGEPAADEPEPEPEPAAGEPAAEPEPEPMADPSIAPTAGTDGGASLVSGGEAASPSAAASGPEPRGAQGDAKGSFVIPRGPAWGGDWDTVMSDAEPIDPRTATVSG